MNPQLLATAIVVVGLLPSIGNAQTVFHKLFNLGRTTQKLKIPTLEEPPLAQLEEAELARTTWASADGLDWSIRARQTGNSSVIYLSQQACERWRSAGHSNTAGSFWINGSRPAAATCRAGVNKAVYDDLTLDAKGVEVMLFGASFHRR